MAQKFLPLLVVMLSFLTAVAASEMTSGRTFVHLRPEMNSFWRTATNNVVELPIDMPHSAKTATLRVEGTGYERTYPDLPEGSYRLELPEASSPDKEDVYTLTLTFDNGTERTARVAVIQGRANCAARCLVDPSSLDWRRASRRAVIPVAYDPSGTSEISVNGTRIDTGLDGAQGWCVLNDIAVGKTYSLAYEADDIVRTVDIVGYVKHFSIIIR